MRLSLVVGDGDFAVVGVRRWAHRCTGSGYMEGADSRGLKQEMFAVLKGPQSLPFVTSGDSIPFVGLPEPEH